MKYSFRLLFIILVNVLLGFNVVSVVIGQEYDPNTFDSEEIVFSTLGTLLPSNTIEEVLTGNDIRIVSLNLTFEIPENLFLLGNDLTLNYGVKLKLTNLEISTNTSVFISVIWNNEELTWSTPVHLTNDTAISGLIYPFSTQFVPDLAVQNQNQLIIKFGIQTYNISSSNVRITIDQNESYIIVSRERGIGDLPSALLTFLILGIFAFFIIILPFWYYASFLYEWRSPIPYLMKIEFVTNKFFTMITRHRSNKMKSCPSCKVSLNSFNYCPNCSLDLNNGILGFFG